MAYFGETLAHSALLGVGLGLLLRRRPDARRRRHDRRGRLATAGAALAARACHRHAARHPVACRARRSASSVEPSDLGALRPMSLLFGDILTVSTARRHRGVAGGAAVLARARLSVARSPGHLPCMRNWPRAEGVKVAPRRSGLRAAHRLLIGDRHEDRRHPADHRPADHPGRGGAAPVAHARRHGGDLAPRSLGMVAVVAGLLLSAFADTPSGPSIVLMARAALCLDLGVPQTN